MKNEKKPGPSGMIPYSAPEVEMILFTEWDIVSTSEPRQYTDPDAAEWD